MRYFKLAGLSLVAGVAALGMDISSNNLIAGASAQAVTLDQVLAAVRRERTEVSAENQAREAEFVSQRNQQRALLNRVRNQVVAAAAESTRLEGVMEANQAEIDTLDEELASKQGEFQELFGAARSAAADLNAQVSRSLISAQFPGRGETLRELAQTKKLPSEDQLRDLWEVMIQQIAEQGKTASFEANILRADGKGATETVTRVGPYVAFSDGKYLTYKPDLNSLQFLAKQPAKDITDAARRVQNASGDGFVKAAIDPALGQIMNLQVAAPSIREKVDQGRFIGKVILAAAAFGILLGSYKWVTLTMTAGAVRSQVRRKKASKSNPLGRVMLAYENTQSNDVETVALKLDDAILKEVPKLESGLNLIKVLAAVSPLLGLLGTVIGMINTFQAITLYGTGDPQIMASGISEALVTTVLGLIAAIPLILLHAFASGASKRVSQILEEQSAGIIAEHAEGGR